MPKVAIVTGASSGIGKEMALKLAQQGYQVGVIARREALLKEVVTKIDASGGKGCFAVCDMADRKSVVAAIRSIESMLGPTDLLIANAGIADSVSINRFNIDSVERLFQVNVLGLVYCIEAVLPAMKQRRSGQIVGISSLASWLAFPGSWAYSASKAAVNKILLGVRRESRRYGIHVTTICPGFVKTPMTDDIGHKMPLVLDADKAADLMLNAIEQKKKFYAYPWLLFVLVQLSRIIPEFIYSFAFGFQRKTYKKNQ
tara:strand:+ start:270 stop:1040 length:771 start_codon:yes stop_codon:yes gene_type:complete